MKNELRHVGQVLGQGAVANFNAGQLLDTTGRCARLGKEMEDEAMYPLGGATTRTAGGGPACLLIHISG